jgi:hypothetical protein
MSRRPHSGASEGSNTAANVSWRGWGFLSLLIGALVSYLCIYRPLAAAARQEARITLWTYGAVICPALLVLGLVLTIFGKRAGAILYITPRQLSGLGWLFAVVMTGIGFLVYFWLKKAVESYGYTALSPR